jgi:hypothetical protein
MYGRRQTVCLFVFCLCTQLRFLGSDNRQTYFTNVQRGRILYEILSTVLFGKKKKGEVGIDRLLEEGAFSSAFPLHDVSAVCSNVASMQEEPHRGTEGMYCFRAHTRFRRLSTRGL